MSGNALKLKFFFLCSPERKQLYDNLLADLPYVTEILTNVEDLLYKCRTETPGGVLVDIASAARLGSALVNSFFDMRVGWPRMRCAVHPDGSATVMCTDPDWSGPLAGALRSIADCDSVWSQKWHRKEFRLAFRCRVRWRAVEKTHWTLGNTLDISCGGAFILMYEPPARGRRMVLEFHDLLAQPARLEAVVAWTRHWDAGPELPGAGLQFAPETADPDLKAAVKNLIGFAALENQ